MFNSKNTKRSLLMSALALVLCVSMLVGSTFAWFTDTATTGVNRIQSGTLDIQLLMYDGANWVNAENQTLNFIAADGNEDILWEPGCTYELPALKVVNKGNLALKYQIHITGIEGDAKLLEVIDFTIEGSNALNGTLAPDAETPAITLIGHMAEEADNDYMGLTMEAISITVVATQLNAENDSYGPDYDQMATIDTEDELREALAADYDLIVLGANIAITNSVEIPADKTVTIDLMGFTMSQVNAQQTTAYAMIVNKGNLTIEDSIGSGKISYTDTTPYTADPGWASNTIRNEGTLTVNGGTVENLTPEEVKNFGYPHAIDAYQGSLTTVNGGTVKSLNYDSIRMFCNSETLATKVVINGGTIVNRVSFQDPHSTRPGYGILEINGGNFVTTDGVSANVRLLNFCANCNNMKATVTGGTFDKGFKTQDIGGSGITTSEWLNMGTGVAVTTAAELQAALDAAVDGTVINLVAGITDDVTATQKPDVKVTIEGNGMTYAGVITVDGKSGTYTTAGLTIKNVNFVADSISADACIRLGDGMSATRYTCNVTVEGCTFDVPGAVGVKSYTGGDKNLKVIDCTATSAMHSLVQLAGVDDVLIEGCTVNSKNGANFNQSDNVTISGCTFDTQGYAARFGASSGNTGAAETYLIKDCSLESANDDGDATIILRGTADYSTLTIQNTTIIGTPDIANNATGATVNK